MVSAEGEADFAPQRYVSLRFFDAHIHRLALLGLTEGGIVALAVYVAFLMRLQGFPATLAAFQAITAPVWPRALLAAGVFVVSLAAVGLYQLRQRARFDGVLARLVLALVLAELTLAAIFQVAPPRFADAGETVLVGAFAFAGLVLTRFFFLLLVDEEVFKRRVLVWGAGARASLIGKRLRRRADRRGFRIIGYLRAAGDRDEIADAQLVHSAGDLVSLALRDKIHEIVVAMDDRRAGFPAAELLECRLRGIQITDIVTFLERESGHVSVELLNPSWLIFSRGFRCDFFRLASKRAFDVLASLAILLVTLPVSLLTAFAIFLEDRGPIFYRQQRVGLNGRRFRICKFRSMRVDAEKDGEAVWATSDDARVTRVGAVIRKMRIDELPQLFNVLVGEMSLVGPRPERPAFVEQLARSIPYYPQRHFVKPGITGWAQVRYGYGASEKDARKKLEYDLFYVKHHTLVFDLAVLLQTVEIVLFRIGSR